MLDTLQHLLTDPLTILACGVFTVVGMIVFLRVNAFLALLTAALVVSFMTPLAPGQFWDANITNVCTAFGNTAGKIGILIAMGAIIGKCMLESGSADRIIRFLIRLFGERFIPAALLASGFLLSIPVFYDTTFYLLVPIARSIYRRVKKNYILFLMAIGLGATISHTLIPPTPGPLIIADRLHIPIGTLLIVSLLVGSCTAPFALGIAFLMNRLLPNPEIHFEDEDIVPETDVPETNAEAAGPSLFCAFAPILIPVLLIATQTTIDMLERAKTLVWPESLEPLRNVCRLLGNPQFALILAATVSMLILYRVRKHSLNSLARSIEAAVVSAGMIILITSAGGAFGGVLQESGIGPRILELFRERGELTGTLLLLLAFGIAAMIKSAQGSSTTAMITAAGIFSGILETAAGNLPYNPAYVAVTIGLGACVTGWMNDSGFWIFCRMGGVKETDALKTWTVGLVLLGLSGLAVVLLLSRILPFTTLP